MTPGENFQFGKLPTEMFLSGALRAVAGKPAALLTYMAYVAMADASMESWPSESFIAEACNIDADSVRRARRALEDADLITDTGRRVHRCKVYRIVTKPRNNAGCSNDKPRSDAGYDKVKPRNDTGYRNPETPQWCGRNPEMEPPKPRSGAGQTEEQSRTEQQQAAPAGAAAAGDTALAEAANIESAHPGVLEALTAAGIGEPTRSGLAVTAGVTVPLIRAAVGHCRERGKGSGTLVNEIRSRAERVQLATVQKFKAGVSDTRRRKAAREEEQRLDRERADLRAWAEGLTPERRQALREAAIASAPTARTADRWRALAPEDREPDTLIVAMQSVDERAEEEVPCVT